MNILDTIIEHKRTEVAAQKAAVAKATLEKSAFLAGAFIVEGGTDRSSVYGDHCGVQKAVSFEGGDQRQGFSGGCYPRLYGRGCGLSVGAD